MMLSKPLLMMALSKPLLMMTLSKPQGTHAHTKAQKRQELLQKRGEKRPQYPAVVLRQDAA
jgi:hypothetical protein